jgi:dihydrofolate reductase
MQIVYYVAMSLDGRIAGPDHDLAFLQTLAGGIDAYGYEDFFAEIDGLVLGAGTYEFMTQHSWPYGDLPTWLVTHRDDLPDIEGANLRRFSGEVRDLVRELEETGLERVWLIGGGNLAAQFLEADRLDELILTLAPSFVGRGPALADGEFPLRRFRLVSVDRPEGTDGVSLRYERADDRSLD